MKIQTVHKELVRGLEIAQRAVSSKSKLPITENFLIEASEQKLTVSATNLETSITAAIGAQIHEGGSVLVPARFFTDSIKSISNSETLEIEAQAGEEQVYGDMTKGTLAHMAAGRLVVKAGKSRSSVKYVSSEDFPALVKEAERCKTFDLDGAALRVAIQRSIIAVGRGKTLEATPILGGAQLNVTGGLFSLVCTDGFRMGVARGTLLSSSPLECSAVVPVEVLRHLLRVITDSAEVKVTLSDDQVIFEAGVGTAEYVRVSSVLLSGDFPNWERLLPKEHDWDARLTLDAALATQSVKAASLFARENYDILRFRFEDVEDADKEGWPVLSLSGASPEIGSMSGAIAVEKWEGEDCFTAINSRYVLDGLGVFGEKVVFDMRGNKQALAFRLPDSGDYVYVVMPVMVDDETS